MKRATSMLGDTDLHLFNEGSHRRLYRCLGAHPLAGGCWFGAWAPNARRVDVIGDVNGWQPGSGSALQPRASSGIWEGVVHGFAVGAPYKYRIVTSDGSVVEKADPFAAAAEVPPATASVIADLDHDWGDQEWMRTRQAGQRLDTPISIYEVHLGSWGRTVPQSGARFATYRQMAEPLADHAAAHGFTHVELLPVMEHPFYGSWGYQTTGYFAPTARYGEPTGLMALVDHLHQRGIGVILDWVPSHFPADVHGLARFDGTHLYEHADPRQGHHPDWDSSVFNYGRNEVRSFLISSALSWLDRYHVDGLRVDAVASMLYLDYSRAEGEWIPNRYGGRENLEAIEFLRQLNDAVYTEYPDVQTYAEESTAWPLVSRPPYVGGLGFGFKWDMGWMHDTLAYFSQDPVHRRWHHHRLTFRSLYAFTENYTLPLSHDEVVHGKGSLLAKMPGDRWQKFANLRLLYGWQWAQPGKKLLFMGGELAATAEWDHEGTLDWSLHDADGHAGVRRWVADLNACYAAEPALHAGDCDPSGFGWVDANDLEQSVFAFLRRVGGDDQSGVADGATGTDIGDEADGGVGAGRSVLVVINATPVPRHGYRVGVDRIGRWVELVNSDAEIYGGSGQGNLGGVEAIDVEQHGRTASVELTLPPLGIVLLAPEADGEADR